MKEEKPKDDQEAIKNNKESMKKFNQKKGKVFKELRLEHKYLWKLLKATKLPEFEDLCK